MYFNNLTNFEKKLSNIHELSMMDMKLKLPVNEQDGMILATIQ